MLGHLRTLEGAVMRGLDEEIQKQYEKILAIPRGSFKDVAGDIIFNCGIRTDGTLTCWSRALELPDRFGPPAGTFQSVSAEKTGCLCGVRTDGRVSCWGVDYQGECVPP
jgi:hypothetical protein